MAKYKTQVTIRRILQLYGDKAAQAARQALKDNAETLVAKARELAPVEKDVYKGRHYKLKHPGRLRESIHVEEGEKKDTLLVVADAKDDKGRCYASLVEYSPRGTPFLLPAYEATKIEMINHAKDLIRAAIRNDAV